MSVPASSKKPDDTPRTSSTKVDEAIATSSVEAKSTLQTSSAKRPPPVIKDAEDEGSRAGLSASQEPRNPNNRLEPRSASAATADGVLATIEAAKARRHEYLESLKHRKHR